MRSRSPNSPLKTSAAAQDPPRSSSKVWRKTSWFKRRRHRLKLVIIFFLFVYFFVWIGVFVWVGGGSDLYDVGHAARLKNMRGVPPPIDMQMGLSQIGNILNFLPLTGNLLVFGLGNDSFYWHDVTKGTVSFIEGGEKLRGLEVKCHNRRYIILTRLRSSQIFQTPNGPRSGSIKSWRSTRTWIAIRSSTRRRWTGTICG